jgi:hypothetical protein
MREGCGLSLQRLRERQHQCAGDHDCGERGGSSEYLLWVGSASSSNAVGRRQYTQ